MMRKIIGFTGSLQNFYEMECAIRALSLLVKNGTPNARMVVVGRDYPPPWGPGRDTLRSLASQLGVAHKLDFLDVVPQAEVPSYINSFDVCLLPLTDRPNWPAAGSALKLPEFSGVRLPGSGNRRRWGYTDSERNGGRVAIQAWRSPGSG